jgi:serine/threonine protein kinase, bacterial
LATVLTRLVSADPTQRFESAGQAMAALNLASPYGDSDHWATPMPLRMQPVTPPPPLVPPAPPPTRVAAPVAPPSSSVYYPTPIDPTYTVPPPPRPVPVQRSNRGCWSALAGLMVVLGAAGGLWWWLDPIDWRQGGTAVTPGGSNAENPAFDEAERVRKQALRDRALALGVDQAYLVSLTDQLFFEQNPNLQGTQLTDRPEDAPLRAEWDAIAAANLDLLETNLSTEARGRLGRYNPSDRDRWQRQVNELYVSSKALYDLTDARFNHLFPGRPQQGFIETPVDQIWFGLAQDQVNALANGETLTEIQFAPDRFSQQLEGTLAPGEGQVFLLNLSQGQLMRLNLQAPPASTRLSVYIPVPTPAVPYILANAEQNTWAGELPQSGYYEIVVVSQAGEPISYRLTVAIDNVIDDIINRPDPPDKAN